MLFSIQLSSDDSHMLENKKEIEEILNSPSPDFFYPPGMQQGPSSACTHESGRRRTQKLTQRLMILPSLSSLSSPPEGISDF